MKSEFISNLDIVLLNDDTWKLINPLVYISEIARYIVVPRGFRTDLASVPRIPIIYAMWGDRAHREAVIHDYLYRSDCAVPVNRAIADAIFLEAMKSRGVAWHIRYPMYAGVCVGGWAHYHKRRVME